MGSRKRAPKKAEDLAILRTVAERKLAGYAHTQIAASVNRTPTGLQDLLDRYHNEYEEELFSVRQEQADLVKGYHDLAIQKEAELQYESRKRLLDVVKDSPLEDIAVKAALGTRNSVPALTQINVSTSGTDAGNQTEAEPQNLTLTSQLHAVLAVASEKIPRNPEELIPLELSDSVKPTVVESIAIGTKPHRSRPNGNGNGNGNGVQRKVSKSTDYATLAGVSSVPTPGRNSLS